MPEFDQRYPLEDFSRFVVQELPAFNTNKSSDSLKFLRDGLDLLPSTHLIDNISSQSEDTAAICLGDLGIFASSLVVRGIRLNHDVPTIVEDLLLLSRKTGLPPRDNYYAYTELNFSGDAMRTFIGTDEERKWVEYNQTILVHLRDTIRSIKGLYRTESWAEATNKGNARVANESMNNVSNIMLEIRNTLPPQLFFSMAEFSQPFEIGHNTWIDREGNITSLVPKAQVPDPNIALIDGLMYGIDDQQNRYLQTMYPHMTYSRRGELQKIHSDQRPSLVDRFLIESADPQTYETREHVLNLYRQMWRWRSFHNSAATTHIRRYGRGLKPDGTFSYDNQLYSLLDRSKHFYDFVKNSHL